jgi:hypothetical protein
MKTVQCLFMAVKMVVTSSTVTYVRVHKTALSKAMSAYQCRSPHATNVANKVTKKSLVLLYKKTYQTKK